MARLPSGISSVIVDPVAINVSSSTVTGATRLEFVNYDGKNKFKSIVKDRAFVGSNSNLTDN